MPDVRPDPKPAGKKGKRTGSSKRRRLEAADLAGGRCEASAAPTCTGRGEQAHHKRTRAQGGTNEVANLLWVCPYCHEFIHRNPALSYERGWLTTTAAERLL
jgi:HNH endonuclease